jgi:hypothetical protein
MLLIIIACDAQFQAGQKAIGGQVAFGINNFSVPLPYNSQKATALSVNLSLSHFRSPTLLNSFGIAYNYNYSLFYSGSLLEKNTSSNNNIDAFVSSTKLKSLAKDFYFTLTGMARASYSSFNIKQPSINGEARTHGYGAGLTGSIGVMYRLNQRFLLNCDFSNLLSASYGHTVHTNNTYSTNTFNFSTGLSGFSMNSLAFGVKYLLN